MNGSVRNEYDHDTFGTRAHVKTANSGSNQHFGYTGEMFDAESGLLYLRARYYDPAIGRFISADPYLGRMAQPVTQNRYIYVHNNPLLFVDPSGLCSVLDTHTRWIDCMRKSMNVSLALGAVALSTGGLSTVITSPVLAYATFTATGLSIAESVAKDQPLEKTRIST